MDLFALAPDRANTVADAAPATSKSDARSPGEPGAPPGHGADADRLSLSRQAQAALDAMDEASKDYLKPRVQKNKLIQATTNHQPSKTK